MRKKKSLQYLLVSIICIFLIPAVAAAALVNGGFESDFSGWTTGGNTAIVTAYNLIRDLNDNTSGTESFAPFEGAKMAAISDPTLGGSLWSNYVLQDVTVGPDDNYLNFAYNFWTYDEAPFDDPGLLVEINGRTWFTAKAGDIGDGQTETLDFTGWNALSIPIAQYYDPVRPASIRISFNAGNTGDAQFPSGALIDGTSVSQSNAFPVVPVPTTALLLGSALVGVIGLRAKTKRM
jgi:hypothetical protein